MDKETLDDEVRKYLKSDAGKQLLHFEVRSALGKYLKTWGALLGVSGLLGLVIVLWWITSAISEKATELAIESVRERSSEQFQDIDNGLKQRRERIEKLGETAAVLAHEMEQADESLVTLTGLVTESETRAKDVENRLSGIKDMLDTDKKVKLVEAIKVLDEHEDAQAILTRLKTLEGSIGKITHQDLAELESALSRRISSLGTRFRSQFSSLESRTGSVRSTTDGIEIGNGDSKIVIRAGEKYVQLKMTTKGGQEIELAANDHTPSGEKQETWFTFGTGTGRVKLKSAEDESAHLVLGYDNLTSSDVSRLTDAPTGP